MRPGVLILTFVVVVLVYIAYTAQNPKYIKAWKLRDLNTIKEIVVKSLPADCNLNGQYNVEFLSIEPSEYLKGLGRRENTAVVEITSTDGRVTREVYPIATGGGVDVTVKDLEVIKVKSKCINIHVCKACCGDFTCEINITTLLIPAKYENSIGTLVITEKHVKSPGTGNCKDKVENGIQCYPILIVEEKNA